MPIVEASEGPVGVFDSGVGGLTVLHELLVGLPAEDYLYFGDTANFPYGERRSDELLGFAEGIAGHLVDSGAKLLVIACNSATASALGALREKLSGGAEPIDVIGVIEPESVLAAATTRNGGIGLLATTATVDSGAYDRAVALADPHTRLTSVACPMLAPMIQAGNTHDEAAVELVRGYCEPLMQAEVDTVILGCTHYPLIRPLLQRTLGPDVSIVTSGDAVARRVEHALSVRGLSRNGKEQGSYRFQCSGPADEFREAGERFLQLPLGEVMQVDLTGAGG